MVTPTRPPSKNEEEQRLAQAIRDPRWLKSRIHGKPFGYPPRTRKQMRLDRVEYKTRVVVTGLKQTVSLLLTPFRVIGWFLKNINDIMMTVLFLWITGFIGLLALLALKAYLK